MNLSLFFKFKLFYPPHTHKALTTLFGISFDYLDNSEAILDAPLLNPTNYNLHSLFSKLLSFSYKVNISLNYFNRSNISDTSSD